MAQHQYSYQACDMEGKIVTGIENAETEQEVVTLLLSRQLTPLKVEEAAESGGSLFESQRISNKDVITFTEGLTTLLESHVPLDRALILLEDLTDSEKMRKLVADLRVDVKEGKTLASALGGHPKIFSKMYINMVHAGEEGGILDKLLPKLASFLAASEEAKRTVMSSMMYPIILSVVGIISVVSLLIFVIPQFASVFRDMGSVPPSAAFLLGLSAWLKQYGWSLILVPFLAYLGWKQLDATPERRLQRDQFLLSLPIMGDVILQSESSRFCRTLGALLHAGIPLLKGLHITRGVMQNNVLEKTLAEVEEVVRGGSSLGKALSNTKKFPTLLSQLIIVGEESGRTASILEKLAETFDKTVKQQTERLVSLVEPLLILFLGVVVGGIVIVMLSAIFSINQVNF